MSEAERGSDSEAVRGPSPAQTFLFADLAGFTALTEAHGDEEAADLIASFCAEVRQLLPDHGAEEIKAMGDALMIRTDGAAAAVRLALRIVGEVGGRHAFPAVRVGLHTGPAVARGGDWFGATVNLASRVSGHAAAGEVLLTDATRRAALDELGEVELVRRERARFKNVGQPVELWAVFLDEEGGRAAGWRSTPSAGWPSFPSAPSRPRAMGVARCISARARAPTRSVRIRSATPDRQEVTGAAPEAWYV